MALGDLGALLQKINLQLVAIAVCHCSWGLARSSPLSPASTMTASSAQCTHLAREEYGGESIWSEVWRLVGALRWRGRAMPLLPSYRSTGARYEHPMVMAVRMVARRRASLRWWWLSSGVVWATGGAAAGSSVVPSRSEGRRTDPDMGL